jgi:hypothetical protein
MSDNDDEQFVPRSDEELARLLEAQMMQMRSQTAEQPRIPSPAPDAGLDEIFGALLEDTTNPIDIPVSIEPNEDSVEVPSFEEPDVTQPISFITQPAEETVFVEEILAATTISEAATSTPVPSMFGESEFITTPIDEPAFDEELAFVEERVVVESTVSVVTETVHEPNPIVSFEPRPSFDELVFGVSSDD